MKNERLKQFAACLLVVISLFVSSVAACACSHHQEKIEPVAASCHEHSTETHSSQTNQSPELSTAFDSDDECVCVQSAPPVFAKSEIVKIEKQAALVSTNNKITVELKAQISTVEIPDFVKPFYLSDSVYNLKSPRAPPIL